MIWNLAWPDGKKTALTFSFDDGRREDIRLVALLDKHGLRGTFNLNSGILPPNGPTATGQASYVHSTEVREVYKNHEVAAHGVDHAFLPRLGQGQRCTEIFQDRANLEALTGSPVTGYAYAFCATSPEVARDVQTCGCVYARSCGPGTFELPADWFDWCLTCHQHEFPDKLETYLNAKRPGPLLGVWGHSYEFPRSITWEAFEAACAKAVGSGHFWAGTCLQIYEYVQDWRRLAFGATGRMVRNPTWRDLWIMHGHAWASTPVCVPAGATIELHAP